jgi:hypothetical protein
MDAMTYRVVGLLIQALEAIAREHHDIVDTDHPQVQRPNWAMRATNLLDEVREEFGRGAAE